MNLVSGAGCLMRLNLVRTWGGSVVEHLFFEGVIRLLGILGGVNRCALAAVEFGNGVLDTGA